MNSAVKVMIVDDNAEIRALIRGMLQSAAVRTPQTIKNWIRRKVLTFHAPADIRGEDKDRLVALLARLADADTFVTPTVATALENGCGQLQYNTLVTQLIYQEQRN